MARLVINASHALDDPERATLAFIIGATAVSADQDCTIVLTIEGVRLAVAGVAESIQKEGFRPLGELFTEFVQGGGEVWACGACCKPRGIGEADMRAGARMVGASNVVEVLLQSGASFSV
ncbi:MAG: DsrE family protein [Longimicrobiales bacterium]